MRTYRRGGQILRPGHGGRSPRQTERRTGSRWGLRDLPRVALAKRFKTRWRTETSLPGWAPLANVARRYRDEREYPHWALGGFGWHGPSNGLGFGEGCPARQATRNTGATSSGKCGMLPESRGGRWGMDESKASRAALRSSKTMRSSQACAEVRQPMSTLRTTSANGQTGRVSQGNPPVADKAAKVLVTIDV